MELIKDNLRYIPKDYRTWSNGTPRNNSEHYENANAYLPSVAFNKEVGKYEVTFTGADTGGYDVATFTYYYDSIEDFLLDMDIDITKINQQKNSK